MTERWNHNIHYDKLVLSSVPAGCSRALDVGCGQGFLTWQLAHRCGETTGIDSDAAVLQAASANSDPGLNINFIAGDVMTHPFLDSSFDFIAAVATLHHLPLRPALMRFRTLLKPGGVLAIVGLYRPDRLSDHLFAAAGLPASWIMRYTQNYVESKAPMKPPLDTFVQIRTASQEYLPHAVLQRRLFFRYSLIWRKPIDSV